MRPLDGINAAVQPVNALVDGAKGARPDNTHLMKLFSIPRYVALLQGKFLKITKAAGQVSA